MPIIDIQRRARELGRIRIGRQEQFEKRDGTTGTKPVKLDRFRFTSPSKPLIENVAALYGGEVQPWTPQGGTQQWEVISTSTRIPILVPPQPVSQWLETWRASGCVHRCDGETNFLTGEPCDLEDDDHIEARPTTRLKTVLRDVEGIGVWRLESHGWNAAVELPDAAAFLAQAGGYVEGWLSLEERVSKAEVDGKVQTRKFMVPIIEIDVTPAQLLAGHGGVAAPQVEGPVARPALAAGPAAAAEPVDEAGMVALIERAASMETLTGLMQQARGLGYVKGEDSPVWQAGMKRRAALEVTAAVETGPGVQPEPDPDVVWQQVLRAGGERGMSLDDLTSDFASVNGGVLPDSASGAELQVYLDALKARATEAGAA